MRISDWSSDVCSSDLDGTFVCSQELHRRRLAAGGSGAILNIGATFAWTGGPGSAHSAAAKAAVTNLTQTLGVEWAIDGVRIYTLAPGYFPHHDTSAHMRPEENTAELPSLMRITDAGFWLTKNK